MNAPTAQSLEIGDGPRLGGYPTPLWTVPDAAGATNAPWINGDGRAGELHDGNKVLEPRRLSRRAGARRHADPEAGFACSYRGAPREMRSERQPVDCMIEPGVCRSDG